MRIPIILADKQLDVTAQQNAGQGYRAIGAASQEALTLVDQIAYQQGQLREKERIAQDSLIAVELDGKMRERVAKINESFLTRTDSENFDKDFKTQIQNMQSEFQPKDASPELTVAFQRSLQRYSGSLFDSITTRKYKVMEERGRIALGGEHDRALEDYAATDDPTKKEIIKKNFELTATKLMNDNIIDPLWVDSHIRGFEKAAKEKEAENDKVAARQLTEKDPINAPDIIRNKNNFKSLSPSDRQAQAEHADRVKKVYENELEMKRKKAEGESHDRQDDAIYAAIRNGDLSKAVSLVDNSSLGAHEKNSWITNIRERQRETDKTKKDPTEISDPMTYAAVATVVYNNPGEITKSEIFKLIGKGENGGLSTVHAEHFANVLKTQMDALKEKRQPKDAARTKEISSGLGILSTNYKYGLFGSKAEGDIKYQKTIEELLQWAEDNPSKNISEKLDQILTPFKKEHTKNILESAWKYFWGVKSEITKPKDEMVETKLVDKDTQNFGIRSDGTPKGTGWLGVLKRPDGRVSTELSVGVNIDGKEVEIPSLVPTLDKTEVDYLLNSPTDSKIFETTVGKRILNKSIEHAKSRISLGLSPFKTDKRQDAIAILKKAGKDTSETSIQKVMSQLK
jgi:hypothetical protein